MSGLGPSLIKIWTCRSSLQRGSRNDWAQIKNVNGASHLSNFWNFFGMIQMISCCDWWPWMKPGYITLTRRQSNNQWSGGIAVLPIPKYSKCKNPLEKFSPQFFLGSRRHPPHWLSSKEPNYQRGALFISAGAIEGHFEGKMPREVHQGGLVLAWQCPALATQKKLAYLGFQCLVHPPILWIWHCQTTTCSLDWKTIGRSPFFTRRRGHRCRGDLVGRTIFWIFFEWLAKVRATGWEVYWTSWGVCWINPEFGRCSLFPSWSG